MNSFRSTGLIALAAGLVVGTLWAMEQTSAATGASARLRSTVFHWENLTARPTSVGQRRDVVDQPTATFERFECHVSTLNAGNISHPPHRHPQEEIIIVKAGTLEVFINGKVERAGPGSLVFFASNDLHNVTNVGDTPATYLVFSLTTAATHAVPAQAAADSAAPGRLRSTVFDWEKLPVRKTKAGARRDVVDSPTVTCAKFECHVTTLNAGEVPHAAHHHPDEELIVVKEGLMEVTINGAAQRAGPGSIIFYASNDEHGMRNAGATTATYYVIRTVTAATPKPV